MKSKLNIFLLILLTGTFAVDYATAQEPEIDVADLLKTVIEDDLEETIAKSTVPTPVNLDLLLKPMEPKEIEADASKFVLEVGTEKLIANEQRVLIKNDKTNLLSTLLESKTPSQKPVSKSPTVANPKCAPGLVNWHSDFEAAKLASKSSGKPVLHFQLLGQLDRRFT